MFTRSRQKHFCVNNSDTFHELLKVIQRIKRHQHFTNPRSLEFRLFEEFAKSQSSIKVSIGIKYRSQPLV